MIEAESTPMMEYRYTVLFEPAEDHLAIPSDKSPVKEEIRVLVPETA